MLTERKNEERQTAVNGQNHHRPKPEKRELNNSDGLTMKESGITRLQTEGARGGEDLGDEALGVWGWKREVTLLNQPGE